MKASDVVNILVDPDNIVTTSVTIPEGLRVEDIVALLVKSTDFPKADFEKALADPQALGLPGVRRGQPGGLPVPGDLRLRPGGAAGRHAPRHGGALAAGIDRQRPRGRRRGARLHAARDHDDRQPDRGRGPRRLPAEDRPGHLQPAGDRPQPGGRIPADRRHGQLRARPVTGRGPDLGGPRGATRRTTPTRTRGCRPDRSRRPATTPSRPRCTRPTARGSSTSRST